MSGIQRTVMPGGRVVSDAGFQESNHPRASNGQFGAGRGPSGSSKATSDPKRAALLMQIAEAKKSYSVNHKGNEYQSTGKTGIHAQTGEPLEEFSHKAPGVEKRLFKTPSGKIYED
jgi:hypothetical protein